MNDRRFDDLARLLATGRLTRRQSLKAALAGVGGMALAGPLATLAAKPAGAAQRAQCGPGYAPCTSEAIVSFHTFMAVCVLGGDVEGCRDAGEDLISRNLETCGNTHCTCPIGTSVCGSSGPGALCCGAAETCEEISVPLLGTVATRCRSQCEPACAPPFDTCCPLANPVGALQSECVNTTENRNHCGGCGVVCAPGETCRDGRCTGCNPPCPDGQTCCGNSCVDVRSDPVNCGACGNTCASGDRCVNGACTGQCRPGETLCGGACVNTQVDPNNCGGCGNVCPGGQSCSGGRCSECQAGFQLCNGVCVDVRTDPHNCGSCGNDCTTQSFYCGVCQNGGCRCRGSEPNGCGPCGG